MIEISKGNSERNSIVFLIQLSYTRRNRKMAGPIVKGFKI